MRISDWSSDVCSSDLDIGEIGDDMTPDRLYRGRLRNDDFKHDAEMNLRSMIHRFEEVLIGLRILHLVEKEFHRVTGAHLHQNAAQYPHLRKLGLVDQQLFLAGA